jgi:hypothetical protein
MRVRSLEEHNRIACVERAMIWLLLVGGIGLVLFAAGEPMLRSVSGLFGKTPAVEVRARPLSAAPMQAPPPDAEGRAPTTGRGSPGEPE